MYKMKYATNAAPLFSFLVAATKNHAYKVMKAVVRKFSPKILYSVSLKMYCIQGLTTPLLSATFKFISHNLTQWLYAGNALIIILIIGIAPVGKHVPKTESE